MVDELRTSHPVDYYASLQCNPGATIALVRPSLVLPVGYAVGGTTVTNSGTCFLPPPAAQRRRRHEFGLGLVDPEQLTKHLDDVEHTLQATPVSLKIMDRNGHLLSKAAKSST
ncbi:GMC family oxidoreductase N-terminal domain-containing protein [Mycobacterium lepromatosis]|uniref:GMC family oxidoreductase N-terminal domain-containing protein n=1 Tax=Mycobacterium lepromatosis TaxID=480418 RepID=UPI000AB255F1|nr:GMC family oxidoreductase N-terminal domain-containing protein [Mycobacterium lepromatosis]